MKGKDETALLIGVDQKFIVSQGPKVWCGLVWKLIGQALSNLGFDALITAPYHSEEIILGDHWFWVEAMIEPVDELNLISSKSNLRCTHGGLRQVSA